MDQLQQSIMGSSRTRQETIIACVPKEAAALVGQHVETVRRYARRGYIVVERNPGPRGHLLVLVERSKITGHARLVSR
jgi:hypothetical protein